MAKRHATEYTDVINGDTTLCARPVTPRVQVDNAFPNCKRCLRVIARRVREATA